MTSESDEDTFLYFAYGSNLSKARIHINNPSAVFYSIAKLQDYKLIFGSQENWVSARWHGGTANIAKMPGHQVWGAIWKLRSQYVESLDRQEEHYQPIEVCVSAPRNPAGTNMSSTTSGDNNLDMKEYKCRTYEMIECIPQVSSPQYKNVIVTGAKEIGLPEEYMKYLHALQDNGYDGHLEICNKL